MVENTAYSIGYKRGLSFMEKEAERSYDRGVEHGYDIIKEIDLLPPSVKKDCFGVNTTTLILGRYSIMEIEIALIKYRKEQERCKSILVGNVVRFRDDDATKILVTEVSSKNRISGITMCSPNRNSGSTWCNLDPEYLVNTGERVNVDFLNDTGNYAE